MDRRIPVLIGKNIVRAMLLVFAVSIVTFWLMKASPMDPLQTNVGQAALGSMSREQIEKLEIKCESAGQKVKELSGGNQQKVCIARAVLVAPKVLFVMEPTRGVDIGAKEKILNSLVQINREQGTTVVVASSELEELKRISDRIAVFCEGKLSRILPPDAADEEFAFAFTGEEGKDGR